MANGVLFNSSGSIVLAVNYSIMGPYSGKFIERKDAGTLTILAEAFIRIASAVVIVDTDVDIDVNNLDTGAAFAVSETYYIYACQPLDGSGLPVFLISVNSTFPDGGWTADNSRKIGGFVTDGSGDIAAAGNELWDLRSADIDGAVASSLFDANTILAATSDNTPAAITIAEQSVVGRLTGGNIKALSRTELVELAYNAYQTQTGVEIIAYS